MAHDTPKPPRRRLQEHLGRRRLDIGRGGGSRSRVSAGGRRTAAIVLWGDPRRRVACDVRRGGGSGECDQGDLCPSAAPRALEPVNVGSVNGRDGRWRGWICARAERGAGEEHSLFCSWPLCQQTIEPTRSSPCNFIGSRIAACSSIAIRSYPFIPRHTSTRAYSVPCGKDHIYTYMFSVASIYAAAL